MDQNAIGWTKAWMERRDPPPGKSRLHVYAGGRNRRIQHRSLCSETRARKQLDRDGTPGDDRWGQRTHGWVSTRYKAQHTSALRDVAEHALRAPDDSGAIVLTVQGVKMKG